MYDSIFYVPLTTAMLGTDKEGSDDNTGSPRRPSFGKSMSAKNIITAIHPLEAAGKVASTAGKVANAVVNKVGGKTDRKGIDFIFTLEDTVSLNNEKSHGELGKLTVTYEELLSAYKHTITQTCPIGNNGAHLEFRIVFTGTCVCQISSRRPSHAHYLYCFYFIVAFTFDRCAIGRRTRGTGSPSTGKY